MIAIDQVGQVATDLATFSFNETNRVRVTMRDNGPWFVLRDVCDVLGLGSAANVPGRLDPDEKGTMIVKTLGGAQEVTIVSESGLYALVLTSRKPGAKLFRRWVTGEVIPALRKRGFYSIPGTELHSDVTSALADPRVLQRLLLENAGERIRLEERVHALEPKADALDRISGTTGSLCLTDAAKALGQAPKRLIDLLSERAWIFRRTGTGRWVGYQSKVAAGLLEHRVTVIARSDVGTRMVEQVLITPRGIVKLSEMLE